MAGGYVVGVPRAIENGANGADGGDAVLPVSPFSISTIYYSFLTKIYSYVTAYLGMCSAL